MCPSKPKIPPAPPPQAPVGDGPKIELNPIAKAAIGASGEVLKRGQGTSSLRIPRNVTSGLSIPKE